MWGWKHVKMNWYVPANIYICSLCLFILPPIFDKHSGCYGKSLFDIAKNPKSWNIFDNTGCVLSETAVNGPETSRPGVPGPQITNYSGESTVTYISRFLRMSFCKGYSSHFNTSPSQFSLFEFLYTISLASKSLIVYVLDDCQIWNAVSLTNTSIFCYLNLLKESFPYSSG